MDYCCFATQQPFDDKDNLNALYIRQPYSHQVIQLVECAPPPREPYQPSRISSYVASSSSESSSSSSSSSAPMSSSPDEDESESISSYCSSEQDAGSAPLPPSPPASRDPTIDDTYRVRMKRIHAWRDALHPDDPSLLSTESPLCPSRKRKVADDSDDDSHDESYPDTIPSSPRKLARSVTSSRSLGTHSCPACDAHFASPQGLRLHGRSSSSANDACRIAVEYGFE
ncbi:uncharacterized protein STEHIDRAFT_150588 [Stereum hirsutum FP-91666 SS1]|uniref:Uncharacterized protein n=1 Tax=Stereum hirsutum (strain FP-91666) TaxID=721885 RepID=R7RYB3_STEHR|nr:uncharacterized protein STEHIDRAFT_150588 [Stereum hirsutum FP-91666 SS1]EIM80396.1 hypothetical protein STEHIDRAFT_150588 [Stereum hirsutum FP-91666 SS1]